MKEPPYIWPQSVMMEEVFMFEMNQPLFNQPQSVIMELFMFEVKQTPFMWPQSVIIKERFYVRGETVSIHLASVCGDEISFFMFQVEQPPYLWPKSRWDTALTKQREQTAVVNDRLKRTLHGKMSLTAGQCLPTLPQK